MIAIGFPPYIRDKINRKKEASSYKQLMSELGQLESLVRSRNNLSYSGKNWRIGNSSGNSSSTWKQVSSSKKSEYKPRSICENLRIICKISL